MSKYNSDYQKKYRAAHREKMRAYQRKWMKAHPEISRRNALKRLYGITVEQWEVLFDRQERMCAVCTLDESDYKGKWYTDHNHRTGKVRGIVCVRCNQVIGALEDPAVSLAQDYITRYSGERIKEIEEEVSAAVETAATAKREEKDAEE